LESYAREYERLFTAAPPTGDSIDQPLLVFLAGTGLLAAWFLLRRRQKRRKY